MPVNTKFIVLFLTKLISIDAEISLEVDSNNIFISQTDS
ncbi:hypothetical protein DDI_2509 [Dickeya dianthicola RNS04.9]|nr:hypothetical protein DDI_2509 [Dickeya dianthicola RNS04.9]